MKTIHQIIFVLFSVALALPISVFANGGDQRIAEGQYLINLSRAPFTPRVGIETSLLASFVDLKTNKLVRDDLVARVRIAKLGGGSGKREFVFEKRDIRVNGGVTSFKHTFIESGLHEIFFDFVLASNPGKIYEAPDFLIDVQDKKSWLDVNQFAAGILSSGIVGIILGFALGIWFRQRRAE